MNHPIEINNTIITVKEYQQQRVLTLTDIVALHEVFIGEILAVFFHYCDYFIEGTDYFRIYNDHICTDYVNLYGFDQDSQVGYVFTVTGYCMLMAALTFDNKSKIQREVINKYYHGNGRKICVKQ